MKNTEVKAIQKEKKTGYNVYGLKDRTFRVLMAVAAALMAAAVIQVMLGSLSVPVRAAVFGIIVAAAFVFTLVRKDSGDGIVPYKRGDRFEFLGLYNLSETEILNSNDILPRAEEADFIRDTLERLIFPQSHVKQAICLTGRSGCGKSTIISFFKQKYGGCYYIFDLTDNYMNFQAVLEEKLGSNFDRELDRLVREKKVVFILDQFERYFFLSEEKKETIRQLMIGLCRRNTAIMLSMREEYLADFMKEFDVNNLKKDGRAENGGIKTGILNNLVSIIRDDQKNYHVQRNLASTTYTWRDKNGFENRVKNNHFIHLEHGGGFMEETILEPVGNTVFFCENQNDVRIQTSGIRKSATVLQSKCEILFGDAGREYYDRHRHEPLIEQQILYHMAEYEKKSKAASAEELKKLFEKEDYELLNEYFDIQLSSTGDYFNASRILYLLSSARLNHVVMKRDDLVFGLFENQFSGNGYKKIPRVIDQLEELQLIRKNIKNSDLEYEIAHDFIAQAYLNYSGSNLDRNVKSALDIYMSEYLDSSKQSAMKEKRDYFTKVYRSKYYSLLTAVFAVLVVIVDLLVHFAYNPWRELWADFNVFGDLFTFFPLIMTEVCLLYIYNIYQKVVRFYRGKRAAVCKAVYAVLMIGSVVADVFYPHGMLLYGFLLALMGFNCAFLLDDSYQKACRMELRNYGLKCAMIGIAFAILHLVLWAFNPQFPAYIIFIEMVMMCILVAYAYMAHMTKEHLYGRLMDASSEKINLN